MDHPRSVQPGQGAGGGARRRESMANFKRARGRKGCARTPSFSLSMRTLFRATNSPVALSFALKTCPYVPSPTCSTVSNTSTLRDPQPVSAAMSSTTAPAPAGGVGLLLPTPPARRRRGQARRQTGAAPLAFVWQPRQTYFHKRARLSPSCFSWFPPILLLP
jgi:hypothetical protein